MNVVIGQRTGSDNYKLAKKHKFKPTTVAKACNQADIIQVLLPDEVMPAVYEKEILPYLTKGKILMFSHGFNVHFGYIKAPTGVDVIMVAPKGPGHLVRSEYEKGGGVPCLFSVHKNPSKKAQKVALAYAKAVGGLKAGSYKTTFKDETETDLFGEQAVLCGGLSKLIQAGFETLTKAGYPDVLAYFECLHEVKLIVDLMYEGGISYMRYSISNTAEYGDLTRGSRLITPKTKQEMRKILKEIQSGKFAKEFVNELSRGGKKFRAMEAAEAKHPVEKIGRKLRANMKWIDAK